MGDDNLPHHTKNIEQPKKSDWTNAKKLLELEKKRDARWKTWYTAVIFVLRKRFPANLKHLHIFYHHVEIKPVNLEKWPFLL